MVAVHVSNANVTKQGDPGFGGNRQAGMSPLACISLCACVRSGLSLEVGTMAFLCSELQVAVETQSQTKPHWHTDRQGPRMLLLPSGDTDQNRAIVPEQLGVINAPQPRLMTNTSKHANRTAVIFAFTFQIIYSAAKPMKTWATNFSLWLKIGKRLRHFVCNCPL